MDLLKGTEMLPGPVPQQLHMRVGTPGPDYLFTAATRQMSPLGNAVISIMCPIMFPSQGSVHVCVRVSVCVLISEACAQLSQ